MQRISGVYCIYNRKTGFIYIGASSHINKRFSRHRCVLCAAKHECKPLQTAWSSGSPSDLIFAVIDECNGLRQTLDRHEQFWLDAFPNKYNVNPFASTADGEVWMRTYKKGKPVHSPEQKRKWSEQRKGPLTGKRLAQHLVSIKRAGVISAARRKGKPLSKEHREKIKQGIQRHIALHGKDAFRVRKPITDATRKKLSAALKLAWSKDPERNKRAAENCRKVGLANKQRRAQ